MPYVNIRLAGKLDRQQKEEICRGVTDVIARAANKPKDSILIFIDEDNVVKFAQENKVPFTTFGTLTKAKEVVQLVADEVDTVNKTLARVEQVKRFALLPKKLIAEDGEVTPTMKLKRKYINETYAELIEGMYGKRK